MKNKTYYRLSKDLPFAKAGEIFERHTFKSKDGLSDYDYFEICKLKNGEVNETAFGIKRNDFIDNLGDWFEEIEVCEVPDEFEMGFWTIMYGDEGFYTWYLPSDEGATMTPTEQDKGKEMRFFDAFAGVGGFHVGIQNAYLRENPETEQGSDNSKDELLKWEQPNCVGYSEIDKYAIKVYEKQFGGTNESTSNQTRGTQPREERQHERPDVHTESIGKPTCNNGQPPRNYGDITKINAEELPDFDCLVGGFPCQAFSIAGKRKGFEDTRGTLFFDLARILRAKQPRLFVFENVKGLLSHDSGRTFKTIIQTIDELGYDCQWQVLNSKDFGVPQNRERVYIVGNLRGTPRPEVFPIIGTNGKNTHDKPKEYQALRVTGNNKNTQRLREMDDVSAIKSSNQTNIRSGGTTLIKQLNNPTHSNDRVYASDGISPTLNTLTAVQKDNMVLDDVRIRRLTPLECERLQGFPDNWTAEGTDGPISNSQRYKMCGNAVTTNVVQAIFERILLNMSGRMNNETL